MKQNCAKKNKKKTVEIALRYSEDNITMVYFLALDVSRGCLRHLPYSYSAFFSSYIRYSCLTERKIQTVIRAGISLHYMFNDDLTTFTYSYSSFLLLI